LGASRELVEAAQLGKEAGARIISVTDNSLSPLSRISDLVLTTASRETRRQREELLPFVCQAAVIDSLVTLILQARPDPTQENLAKIAKVIPKLS
jgi:RpiR family carbohydrate utilization transcriptional regulator